MAQENGVSDAAARSVAGAQGGLQQASIGTTAHAFDVSDWKGRYIKFHAVGDDWYYVFSADNTLTIDAATNRATSTATVPDYAEDGERVHEVVPGVPSDPNKPMYLLIRAVSGTLTRASVRRA